MGIGIMLDDNFFSFEYQSLFVKEELLDLN